MSNDDWFNIALFLVASARDCLDEPAIYGPLRMLDCVRKIAEMQNEDKFLVSIRERIYTNVIKVMQDREEFRKELSKLLEDFAEEALRRRSH